MKTDKEILEKAKELILDEKISDDQLIQLTSMVNLYMDALDNARNCIDSLENYCNILEASKEADYAFIKKY